MKSIEILFLFCFYEFLILKLKLGYLRRNSNGTTSMNFLNQDDNTIDKQLTVGNLCEALDSGSYSLNSFIEEKKNKAKPSKFYVE